MTEDDDRDRRRLQIELGFAFGAIAMCFVLGYFLLQLAPNHDVYGPDDPLPPQPAVTVSGAERDRIVRDPFSVVHDSAAPTALPSRSVAPRSADHAASAPSSAAHGSTPVATEPAHPASASPVATTPAPVHSVAPAAPPACLVSLLGICVRL